VRRRAAGALRYDARVSTPAPGPALDDFALARRATPLGALIAAEIAAHGRIAFERFMALALYHPEHGYYSRPGLAWGRNGDYETSPEVHPVFGYLWARQILECWERLGKPAAFDLVEPGAGSGAFAAAMLDWLRERAPECYAAARPALLDGHPRRLDEQRATLEARGHRAEFALLADWLAEPEPIEGIVISNELFDAFPVHLVERRGDELREWYVVAGADGLALELAAASTPALAAHFARLGVRPGDECRAEVSLAAIEAMRGIAARLARGYLLTIDYGHEAARLYAPWRRMGTLMAFRDHSPQPDPLALPGETDLTAHVDLTSLAAAASSEGFEAAPSVSQAEALVALGIGEQLEGARDGAARDLSAYASARRAVDTLLDPTGLGRIRVLAQAKGADLEGLRCLQDVAGAAPASR
jgi:SAM-dependent MidA family methyltransferase